MDNEKQKKIADLAVDAIVREHVEEKRRERLMLQMQAIGPVTNTARACMVQFPVKGVVR